MPPRPGKRQEGTRKATGRPRADTGLLTHPRGRRTRGKAKKTSSRGHRWEKLMSAVSPVPGDWITPIGDDGEKLKPMACSSYKEVVDQWKKATRWRQDMDDVLSIMFSVVASTVQKGDQLFLMVVGNASGGKSQFCDGFILSPYCYQLEYLTGFFSGWKGDDEGKDYSLINRVNGKCMITSEGDVLMANPQFDDIMSKSRRIFDGRASSTFKNTDEDRFYDWIRLTWIIAGTHKMLEKDDASLGDRFLKIFMDSPEEDERRRILRLSRENAWNAVAEESLPGEEMNVTSIVKAQQMTAGYCNWLRENIELLNDVECDDKYFNICEDLAILASIMRARPARDDDVEATKEEPNRLNNQFVRVMRCLCFVMNKKKVDDEIIRRLKKLAFGTGFGIVREVIELLYERDEYISSKSIALYLDRSDERIRKVLRFLRRIGAVQLMQDDPKSSSPARGRTGGKKAACWGLTDYVQELCESVM